MLESGRKCEKVGEGGGEWMKVGESVREWERVGEGGRQWEWERSEATGNLLVLYNNNVMELSCSPWIYISLYMTHPQLLL